MGPLSNKIPSNFGCGGERLGGLVLTDPPGLKSLLSNLSEACRWHKMDVPCCILTVFDATTGFLCI